MLPQFRVMRSSSHFIEMNSILFSYRTANRDKLPALQHTRTQSGRQALLKVPEKSGRVRACCEMSFSQRAKVVLTCNLWSEMLLVNGIRGKAVDIV